MLGEEAACHGGLPACCSPEGPVPWAWCVPSAWGARAGATLHGLVFTGSLPQLGVRMPEFESLLLSWGDLLNRSLRGLVSLSV